MGSGGAEAAEPDARGRRATMLTIVLVEAGEPARCIDVVEFAGGV